jgi:hypothetical protein
LEQCVIKIKARPALHKPISFSSSQGNNPIMQCPPPVSRVLDGDLIHNFPVISLIFANLVTIVLAILGNWDLATVMFSYWLQSVIIGVFAAISLISVGTAREETPGSGGVPESPVLAALVRIGNFTARIGLTVFFVIHYGIFHIAYYMIIVDSGLFGQVNFTDPGLWFACGIFFVNHLYSFVAHWNVHIREVGGDDFLAPYRRIIPMHLTIIFGGMVIFGLQDLGITSTMPVLLLFLVLKMVVDISTHLARHSPPGTSGSSP